MWARSVVVRNAWLDIIEWSTRQCGREQWHGTLLTSVPVACLVSWLGQRQVRVDFTSISFLTAASVLMNLESASVSGSGEAGGWLSATAQFNPLICTLEPSQNGRTGWWTFMYVNSFLGPPISRLPNGTKQRRQADRYKLTGTHGAYISTVPPRSPSTPSPASHAPAGKPLPPTLIPLMHISCAVVFMPRCSDGGRWYLLNRGWLFVVVGGGVTGSRVHLRTPNGTFSGIAISARKSPEVQTPLFG